MQLTVFTYPFPTAGTGAGSAAAAKLLLNCSSFCLEQKTAGPSWLGYTDRDTTEKQRAWRASRAAAARAALRAPNMVVQIWLENCRRNGSTSLLMCPRYPAFPSRRIGKT